MLDMITNLLVTYISLVINAFLDLFSSIGNGPEMFKATLLIVFTVMPIILLFQGIRNVWRNFTNRKNEPPSSTKIHTYVGLYLGLHLLIGLIHQFTDLNAQASWGVQFIAGIGTMLFFVTRNKRVPLLDEKRNLVIWCIIFTYIGTVLVGIVATITIDGIDQLEGLFIVFRHIFIDSPLILSVGTLILMSGILYAMFSVIFGWGARVYFENVIEKNN